MSYRQIIYHIVFRTKYNRNAINEEHADELYKYIWGIVKNKNGKLYRVNGTENHLHILSDLHPSLALADFVKIIKVSSSKWMKASGLFPHFVGWATKYCALSVSYKEKDRLIEYIKNQREHHKTHSFKKEMERVFIEAGIDDSAQWFWKDN